MNLLRLVWSNLLARLRDYRRRDELTVVQYRRIWSR